MCRLYELCLAFVLLSFVYFIGISLDNIEFLFVVLTTFLADIVLLMPIFNRHIYVSESALQQIRLKKHIGGWWLQTIQMQVAAIILHPKLMKQKICYLERPRVVAQHFEAPMKPFFPLFSHYAILTRFQLQFFWPSSNYLLHYQFDREKTEN